MILKRREITIPGEMTAFECDVCRRRYDPTTKNTYDGLQDSIEVNEVHAISFEAGYGSVFGDGNTVECEVCQHCLKRLLGDYMRVQERETVDEKKDQDVVKEEKN